MCWTCIALHGQHQLDLCSFLNSNMDEQPFFFFFLMGCNTMLGSEEYGSSTTLNCQCDISLSSIWTTNVVASKTTFNYINKQHTNHRLHTRPVRCHRYIIKPSSPSISRLTILMMSFYRIYPCVTNFPWRLTKSRWRPETFRSDDFKFIFGNSPFCSFLFIINTLSWNS
jgi:hypothetical protein